MHTTQLCYEHRRLQSNGLFVRYRLKVMRSFFFVNKHPKVFSTSSQRVMYCHIPSSLPLFADQIRGKSIFSSFTSASSSLTAFALLNWKDPSICGTLKIVHCLWATCKQWPISGIFLLSNYSSTFATAYVECKLEKCVWQCGPQSTKYLDSPV